MFRRIKASYWKELLVVIRDYGGLAILFIMPMSLIIIMALIQDAPFKNFQESGIKIAWLNNDNDSLGSMMENGFNQSNVFKLNEEFEGKVLTQESLKKSVADGDFKIGVIIPDNATKIVRQNVEVKVTTMLSGFGMGEVTTNIPQADSLNIEIYLDPAAKKSFRTSIVSSLKEFTSKIESKMIMESFMAQLSNGSEEQEMDFAASDFIGIKEIFASHNEELEQAQYSNSVQHNVPAWTLFAMFFIVIPLAGNMIKEKNDGSLTRIKLIPGSYNDILIGKLFFYASLCFIQFVLMTLVGIFILPLLGLPRLSIGNAPVALMLIAFCASLAATGFGTMIGTVFRTHQQAPTFGALGILIFSAIGGVWVPLFAMPEVMRKIGSISPLNWGLQGFNDIFLRGGNLTTIWDESLCLIIFTAICLFIAIRINKIQNKV
jgi:ABC-2 type transport system permease protein